MDSAELVKTIELYVIGDRHGRRDTFRVEILRDCDGFFSSVSRRECFNVRQGEGSVDREFWDAYVFALDIGDDWSCFRGDSADEVLQLVKTRIEEMYEFKT
jgi:hypothetical protein